MIDYILGQQAAAGLLELTSELSVAYSLAH